MIATAVVIGLGGRVVDSLESVIENESGTPILRITRRFAIGSNFDLTMEQRLENLTYERIRRPIYPIDEDMSWSPTR